MIRLNEPEWRQPPRFGRRVLRVRPVVAWYDLWVGFYWDRKKWTLYFLPLPCLGVSLQFWEPNETVIEGTLFFDGAQFPIEIKGGFTSEQWTE